MWERTNWEKVRHTRGWGGKDRKLLWAPAVLVGGPTEIGVPHMNKDPLVLRLKEVNGFSVQLPREKSSPNEPLQ